MVYQTGEQVPRVACETRLNHLGLDPGIFQPVDERVNPFVTLGGVVPDPVVCEPQMPKFMADVPDHPVQQTNVDLLGLVNRGEEHLDLIPLDLNACGLEPPNEVDLLEPLDVGV